jgi:hypothetical protein
MDAIDTAIDESGRNFASSYVGNADPTVVAIDLRGDT